MDGEWAYTWSKGRQLVSMTKPGSTLTFTYDADGNRITKTVNGTTTTYTYVDGRVTHETNGTDIIHYRYDTNGMLLSMSLNGTEYYYLYNGQWDVIGLYDANGNVVVEYTYDAWGKPLTTTGSLGDTVGEKNPYRYRGYRYDAEMGLYYVTSRYYDPEIDRFISPDTTDVLTATPMGLTDKNLYAYCDNNPVVRVDHGGQFWETVFDVISLGASIVEVCINPTDPWAWAGLAGDAIDLIPFVTGVGEVTQAVKTIDKVTDTVQIAKAVDFTDDAADIVKTLDRSSGFTKSTASAGRKIHTGYKATDNFSSIGKEYRRINGIRPDYIDFNTRTIYELKPMNPRGVRSGIHQLQNIIKL